MWMRWSKCLVVLLLVLITGGHWAILQVAAWTGMIVTYSRVDSVGAAIEKTFDGQHPCQLCELVAKGKESTRRTELQQPNLKFELFFVRAESLLPQPPSAEAFHPDLPRWHSSLPAPSVPPPRRALS